MIPTIKPDWPAPPEIQAFTTTRLGGVSEGALATFNLGIRSSDDAHRVAENRARLNRLLPASPHWLHQVHGTRCIEIDQAEPQAEVEADAAWTCRANTVLAILTADCLPVFFAAETGDRIGLAHAGWRGLVGGVLENTLLAMDLPPDQCLVHLGPAIGPAAFEVGPEVRAAFVDQDPGDALAFAPGKGDRWWADLAALARRRLIKVGARRVSGGGRCTFQESVLFYSHRRDPKSGRMASLLWRDESL